MTTSRQKMNRASTMLSKYFGLSSLEDLAARIAQERLHESNPSGQASTIRASDPEAKAIDLIIDTNDGGLTTTQMIKELNELVREAQSEGDDNIVDSLQRLVEIWYTKQQNFNALSDEQDLVSSVNQLISTNSRINQKASKPEKNAPGLSLIMSHSTRVSLQQKNINPTTIFYNGMPNIEIQKAVPYVKVNFYFARPPTNDFRNNKIQSLSLPKFLLGAESVQGDPLSSIVNSKSTKGKQVSDKPKSETYSEVGMELFTTPQTLVNADASNTPNELRANPILDKFQPFMSLNSLNINVQPTKGLMSFKTGKLDLTLHDRSRMSEIGDFIRADLYGVNDIVIEYGWQHPSGLDLASSDNPYGDLINGMKMKEKYMVRNSSFSFDGSGQVSISLDIAMRGGTDFNTELIASDEDSTQSIIKDIRQIEETIGELRERIFPEETGDRIKEVRGVQVLDAAQDALSHLTLTQELKEKMVEFKKDLQDSNPESKQLIDKIEELYGRVRDFRRGERNQEGRIIASGESDGRPAKIAQLRRTVLDSIRRKVENLINGDDPWFIGESAGRNLNHRSRDDREAIRERRKEQRGEEDIEQDPQFSDEFGDEQGFSLGKLMLQFVGEPLSRTHKFDDVQLIFYPFNDKAGKAHDLNIAEFKVNASYFADEFARWRLEHIGRSGNMNLRDFMDFVADILLDDPAAPSYGLVDPEEGALYKNVVTRDGRIQGIETVHNAAEFQDRLERTLRNETGGEWKMPRIDLYAETVPQRQGEKEGEDVNDDEANAKSILRLHIFDRQASSHETVGDILASQRNSDLESVTSLGGKNTKGNNQNEKQLKKEKASQIIQTAVSKGLMEKIRDTDPPIYRVIGGQEQTKNFIMQTVPYIMYGVAGSPIEAANLTSMQNSQLSTVNLLRSFQKEETATPRGENPGGLPMRIIPTELNITSLGCPLINFAQQFFVDFQTGTTADNMYAVNGIDHTLDQSGFRTDIKMLPMDSWGKYRSLVDSVHNAAAVMRDKQQEDDSENPDR